MDVELHFIGHIQTPFRTLAECPRNLEVGGPPCRLVLDENYRPGLSGLTAGQLILVLYWLDLGKRDTLRHPSRRTGEITGVFALRTPNRPNPIGAAVVRIEEIEPGCLTVRGLDCLDGTPLLDIKPAIQAERAEVRGAEDRTGL